MKIFSILLLSLVFMSSGIYHSFAAQQDDAIDKVMADPQVIITSVTPCAEGGYVVTGYIQEVTVEGDEIVVTASGDFTTDCIGGITITNVVITSPDVDEEQFRTGGEAAISAAVAQYFRT